jgi:hypothetical protein
MHHCTTRDGRKRGGGGQGEDESGVEARKESTRKGRLRHAKGLEGSGSHARGDGVDFEERVAIVAKESAV